MELTSRETWTLVHGLILGTFFLLAFAGGLAGLWSLRTEYVTPAGISERLRRLKIGITAMAIAAWATVITGTWIVYPWYREKLAGEDAAGCEGLQVPGDECSPRDFLLSNVSGADGGLAQVRDGVEGAHRLDLADAGDARCLPRLLLRAGAGPEPHGPAPRARRLYRRVRVRGDCGPLRRPDHEDGADHVRIGR
jgi:hypothetical protein